MLDAIVNMVGPAFLPVVISGLAGWLTSKVVAWLDHLTTKTANANEQTFLGKMRDFFKQACMVSEQTYVDEMKKSGKWGDKASNEGALLCAYHAFISLAQADLPDLAHYGVLSATAVTDASQINPWIKHGIESALKEIDMLTGVPAMKSPLRVAVNVESQKASIVEPMPDPKAPTPVTLPQAIANALSQGTIKE